MHYFETIRCEDFQIYHLKYHQQRIARTITKNISLCEYIYPASSELLKCKVVYDQEGVIDVSYSPYTKRNIQTLQLVYDDEIEYSSKYHDRTALEKLFSQKKDADDIVIIKNGLVTDTSIANIAIFVDQKWLTPKKPLLYGTTRQRFIDEKILYEADISIELLQKAENIALLNAMIDFDILQKYTLLV